MEISVYRRLLAAIREKAYKEGDFTLASGQKSSYYIDLKAVTLSGEGGLLIGQAIFPIVKEWGAQAAGGMELGSVPISTAVCLVAAQNDLELANVIVRKEAKGHGTSKKVEGAVFSGVRIAVVEDVTSTGGSSLKAVEALEEAGADVLGIISVVDRRMGAGELYEKKGLKFRPIYSIDDIRNAGDKHM